LRGVEENNADTLIDNRFVRPIPAFTDRTQLANRQIAARGAKGSTGITH